MGKLLMLEDFINNPEMSMLIDKANACLEQIGYTDHGPRHVLYVSKIASDILGKLNYPERRVELAKIAGYVHDVGNLVGRNDHGANGALLLFPVLRDMGMDIAEITDILSAVGSHEERLGKPVSDLSAALIIADKVDAHRARVRLNRYDPEDIHDRVNFSIKKTRVLVDDEEKTITFEFTMDDTSSVTEFMQIYLSRMIMCEESANYLGCEFVLSVNGMRINRVRERD